MCFVDGTCQQSGPVPSGNANTAMGPSANSNGNAVLNSPECFTVSPNAGELITGLTVYAANCVTKGLAMGLPFPSCLTSSQSPPQGQWNYLQNAVQGLSAVL